MPYGENLKINRIHFKKFPNHKLRVKPYKFANIIFKRAILYSIYQELIDNYNEGIALGTGLTSVVRRCWHHSKTN